MPLSPEARSLLDMAYRVGAPKFHELSPAQARHSFQKLQFAFRPEAPAVASTTEVPMARADGSALLSRLYRPLSSAPQDVLPLLIYFHGGGWCVGDVASYDVLCRQLANASGCAVLSVEYRLAPEHPFPAALDDAALAFDWAVQQADLLGIDAGRIALGGDSAGGNLSIVTALSLRGAGIGPRFLLLIYPSTEILSERPSRQRYGEGYFLDFGTLQWFFERYLPDGNTEDWRASPMRAASLAGLPPAMLISAEFDPLVDDCAAFAHRLREEGCEVDYLQVDGMVHGFITLGKLFPHANDAVRAAAGAVAAALRAG
ncbi:alpha/beta hydrolase [Thauera sp. Sel9]|uniref:alpha/beta hydrolase n=1 Tax=Thauera sp. Sel9 TaxID=2974299 RepID=UPI0021E1284C|nr:alpha/beta hydrolase [Thauera sp. Sel9]MCV2217885.1 alpha/beta hydrolase [Thauera sp. Sel9]